MKKILTILLLFFTFLLVACASPTELVKQNKIRPGMTKLEVDNVLIWKTFWDQIAIPESYREYFAKEKKEILSDPNKKIYFVFKNVKR